MKNCLNTWDMKFQSGFEMEDKLYLAINEPHYDGMTSQLYRQVMLWVYCNLNNLNFVYVPFKKIAHNCDPTDAEEFFNFGQGELREHEVDEKINYCFLPKFNTDISYEDISKNLNYFDNFSSQFWNKLRKTKKPKLIYDKNYVNVAVHVRRGDILEHQKDFGWKFHSDEYFISTMYKLKKQNKNIRFYIFSEDVTNKSLKKFPNYFKNCDIFSKFKKINDLDIKLIIDGCPYFALWHLFNSDILIASKGCFSGLPILFHSGKIVVPRGRIFSKKQNLTYSIDPTSELNFSYYENKIYKI